MRKFVFTFSRPMRCTCTVCVISIYN